MLSKSGNDWLLNGEKADSAETMKYLNGLANMQGNGFVDAYSPSSTPVFTLTINGNNQSSPITVVAYPSDSIQKYILHSSLNADGYLSEGQSHLMERIFVGKRTLLKMN